MEKCIMCTDWPEINYTKELDTNVDQKRPETVHLWIKCSFNRYRSIKQYPMCWLGRFKQVPLCPLPFPCHCFHISTTNELRNFPFYINGIEPKGQSRMYNHGTQDDKKKNTQDRKLNYWTTLVLPYNRGWTQVLACTYMQNLYWCYFCFCFLWSFGFHKPSPVITDKTWVFIHVRFAQALVFCVLFFPSCFVLLFSFFLPMDGLFFDLRQLVTHVFCKCLNQPFHVQIYKQILVFLLTTKHLFYLFYCFTCSQLFGFLIFLFRAYLMKMFSETRHPH